MDSIVQNHQLALPVSVAQGDPERLAVDLALEFRGEISGFWTERDTTASSDGRFLIADTSSARALLCVELSVATVHVEAPFRAGRALSCGIGFEYDGAVQNVSSHWCVEILGLIPGEPLRLEVGPGVERL